MKEHRQAGFSLIELLIVVAIIGILLSIGITALPRDRIAVNQAVERFERDIQRARFNAISYNTTVRFAVDAANDVYRATVGADAPPRAGFVVDLERDGLNGVGIQIGGAGSGVCSDAATTATAAEWRFDARGVGRQAPVTLVRIHHRSGFEVALCINAYGRVQRL